LEYCNFAKTILDHRAKFANKLAVVDGQFELTYSDLSERVQQIANYLKHRQIQPGQRVIILMEDCVDWPCVFLACVYIGAVPVPLSFVVGPRLLENIIEFTQCCLLVVGNKAVIQIPSDIDTLTRNKLSEIYDHESKICDPVMVHPDSPGYCGISSGSTGIPKIAVHRHYSFFIARDSLPVAGYGMTSDSVMMSVAKLSWSFGLHNSITSALGIGATAVLIPESPTASVIFEYAHRYSITTLIIGPSVLKHLLKTTRELTFPDSVDLVLSSGEDLPRVIYNEFQKRFGITLQTSIGMLEVCATYAASSKLDHEPGTVGKALPHCEIKIVDANGKECLPGIVGEIYIRTPMNAFYYLNNYAKSKSTFAGEWVCSGDVGYINKNGNLVFYGRKDDVFKVNDLTVSPIEVESQMIAYPDVEQAAVVGIKNTRGINEVHAFVVPGLEFDKDNFANYLKEHLFPHQMPKHLHIVASFPETLTFKKDRAAMARQVAC
jgi:benzoate-CoA ligase